MMTRAGKRFTIDDNLGAPCACLECQAAGVTHLRVVTVPPDEFVSAPHVLHGEALRRWWDARDRVRDGFKALAESKAMGGTAR